MGEAKLRAIFDAAPEAFLVLDDRGRIVRSNPGAEALFGYDAEELRGRPAELLIPAGLPGPALGDGHADPPGRRGRMAGAEARGRRKDGVEFPAEVRVGTAEESGERLVVCVVRDIAEQKRVQEELDRFFQLSLDMLCIAGMDGYFKRLNPAWTRILGYSLEALRSEPYLNFVHPDDREATLAEVRKLSSGGDTVAFENRYRCLDGSYRWILWNATPFLNEGLVLAIAHDITDRKRAEDQLRLQNLRLQEIARSERQAHEALKQAEVQLVQAEKLSALGQMVAGVAHEINNPLAYIGNNLAVLRRDFIELRDLLRLYQGVEGLLGGESAEALAAIRERSDQIDLAYVLENVDGLIDRTRDGLKRIQGIVKDLRDFARLDSSELGEIDPNEALRSTANIIAGRAEAQGVAIALEPGEVPPITCFPGKVNQVLLNLMTNALDACAEGGRITLRTRAAPGGVEFHVVDTGQGIDPGIRDRIFDPFFTTKPIGQGTGLGLSISYGIVRQHGGEIGVESVPGQGTHFTVYLPSEPKAASPPSSPTIAINRYNLR